MAFLRVASTASLLISQDNAPNPAEPTFNSGAKSFVDAATYAHHLSDTLTVPANTDSQYLELTSLTEIDILYLLAKGTGLQVRLIPVGSDVRSTPLMELIANAPCILGAKLSLVQFVNPTGTAITVVVGAAGN